MPNQSRSIPRGPGTADPDFTPSVAVQQTGPVAVDQETPFKRLERAFNTIGGLAAGALQSSANISTNLARLKEQAIARQERVIGQVRQRNASITLSMQQRRLQDVQVQQVELMNKAEQHSPTWLLRQARLGFNNAASVEEQQMWSELLVGSKDVVDQFRADQAEEAENKLIQEFTMASFTAKKAVGQMISNLQASPELQAELIGDGVGIHERVQNWIVSEASAASPEIFNIRASDPDFERKVEQRDELIASLVERSLRVGDSLIGQHVKQTDAVAFQTGMDLASAHLVSFYEGKIDLNLLNRSLTEVGDTSLNAVPDVEKKIKFKQLTINTISAALEGQFGTNLGEIEERSADLIHSGQFNPSEVKALNLMVAERLGKLSIQLFVTDVNTAQLGITKEALIRGEDGTLTIRSVPDPNATIIMATPDPTTGRTRNDEIADQTIAKMGLSDVDPREMSPAQIEAVSRIRQAAAKANTAGVATATKAMQARENTAAYLSGDPRANGNMMLDNIPYTLIYIDGTDDPTTIRFLEEESARTRAEDFRDANGRVTEPQSRRVYDGKPLELTKENRSLIRATSTLTARAVNTPTAAKQPLPSRLMERGLADWTKGNPEAQLRAYHVVANLNPPRRREYLEAWGANSPQSIAMRNAVVNQTLDSDEHSFKQSFDDLMETARQQMNVQDPLKNLAEPTPQSGDGEATNRDLSTAALAANLAGWGASAVDDGDSTKEIRGDLNGLFQRSGGTGSVEQVLSVMSVQMQLGGTAVEAASFAMQQAQQEGLSLVGIAGVPELVYDPLGHFGGDNPNPRISVETKMRGWFTMQLEPRVREQLGKALGLQPKDYPLSYQDAYTKVPSLINPDLIQDDRGSLVKMQVLPANGVHADTRASMQTPANRMGGIPVMVRMADGRILPRLSATQDTILTDADGVEFLVKQGQNLLLFSSHTFDPILEAALKEIGQFRTPEEITFERAGGVSGRGGVFGGTDIGPRPSGPPLRRR